MAGYLNENDQFTSWGNQNNPQYMQDPMNQQGFDNDFNNMQSQQLDFQSFSVDQNNYAPTEASFNQKSFYNPNQHYYPDMYTPTAQPGIDTVESNEFDEPPLLEELEIYPDRILMKTFAVLNPFHSQGLVDDPEFLTKDTDLFGPIIFCIALAVCLFVSGNKAHFGYIYGLSVMSCIMMYCLLSLMSVTSGVFTLMGVASILGYCLLPIVLLSALGVFISLHSTLGMVLAVLAVLWSCLSASRLFVSISGDSSQRPLIAYPCALVCGVFALLVVF